MRVTPSNLAEHDESPTPSAATLDYQTPPRAPAPTGSRRELWLGVAAGLFISVGFGFFLFGALMALGVGSNDASVIAFGTSCMTLGGCFVGLMMWFRRNAR